jgi:hypothetical protein
MDQATAERWVTISALLVIAVYGYRRITETAQPGTLRNVLGQSPPVPLGQFVTAWGVTFLGIAIMAEASPPLGGSFAILIAVADFLNNAQPLFSDLGKQQKQPTAAAGSSSTTPAPGTPGATNPASTGSAFQNPFAPITSPLTGPLTGG